MNPLPHPFRQGVSLNPEYTEWLDCLPSGSGYLLASAFAVGGLQEDVTIPSFYLGPGDLTSSTSLHDRHLPSLLSDLPSFDTWFLETRSLTSLELAV